MEDNKKYKLLEELKETGASDRETEELSVMLESLSSVKTIERSYELKRKFLVGNPIENKGFLFFPRFAFAKVAIFSLIFLIGVVSTAVAAQKSLPGDSLYGVKRLTEKARTAVDPSFQGEVVVRRSEEVKRLSEEKKESGLIKQTVNDYEKEAKDLNGINTDKIDESKKNLEEAKQNVSEEDKKEIERVLEDRSQESNNEVKSLETKNESNSGEESILNQEHKVDSKFSEEK